MTEDDPDFEINHLRSTFSRELMAKSKRLEEVIGQDHWPSVGQYKERILREQLRSIIPDRYSVDTGFCLAYDDGTRVVSDQLDILIWESDEFPPFFRDEHFVVVPPEAVSCIIEVKSTLDRQELRNGLETLLSFDPFLTFGNEIENCPRMLFAFRPRDASRWSRSPERVFETLAEVYSNSDLTLDERRLMHRRPEKGGHVKFGAPWIETIACPEWGLTSLGRIRGPEDTLEYDGVTYLFQEEPDEHHASYNLFEQHVLYRTMASRWEDTVPFRHKDHFEATSLGRPQLSTFELMWPLPETRLDISTLQEAGVRSPLSRSIVSLNEVEDLRSKIWSPEEGRGDG